MTFEQDLIDVEVLYSTSTVGTQILLTRNGKYALVDMGDGAVRDLVSRRIDFEKVKAVLLTHEHFDHFSGLYGFLHFCRLLRRKDELILVAPKPIRVVNHLLKPPVIYQDLPYQVRLIELSDNEDIRIGELKATAFKVDHGSANAAGYSIQDEEGYRVVISGDTAPAPTWSETSEERISQFWKRHMVMPTPNLRQKYGHMTQSQAEKIGAKSKKPIYVHSNPDHYFKRFECSQG